MFPPKAIIEAWRVDYNTMRPHSSLDQLTPVAYAATTDGRTTPEGLSLSV